MKALEETGKLFILTNDCADVINSLRNLVGNRAIKNEKVNKIVKSISEGIYIPSILVDEDSMQVVEGNHRVEAMKRCIEQGIPFRIRMELQHFESPLSIARYINNTGSKWSKNEKLYSFCIEGKPAYLRLRELMDKHPYLCKSIYNDKSYSYNITPTLNCVAMGRTTTTMDSTYSSGNLVITDQQLLYGETIISELEKLQKCVPNTRIFRKEAVVAWRRFRDSLKSFERYLKIFEKKSHMWQEPAQRTADWLNAFYEVSEVC
jgi:hypothetical protein